MEKAVADRCIQMKYISGNEIAMTYIKNTRGKLATLGLILLIMLLSAAIYYFLTGIGSAPFRVTG